MGIGVLSDDAPAGPVLVHSDAFRARRNIPAGLGRSESLTQHLNNVRQFVDGRVLLMPSFNYDFTRTRRYDVANDPSQVGPIPEAFRLAAVERGATPIFNLSSSAPRDRLGVDRPDTGAGRGIDPFAPGSELGLLLELDGTIVFYGATFHSTVVHVTERMASIPYRFEKHICGTVIEDSDESDVTLALHVFPRELDGVVLNYDWPGLEREARSAGVLREPTKGHGVMWARARELHELWLHLLGADPLALLNMESRRWVDARLEQLGRPFIRQDFE